MSRAGTGLLPPSLTVPAVMNRTLDRIVEALPRCSGRAVDPAGSLRALRTHPRRLLYTAGVLVSTLLLCALSVAAVQHVNAFRDQRVQELVRARDALQAHLAERESSQARLSNMTEFVWEHRLASEQATARADLAAFKAAGQRLQIEHDATSTPLTVIGENLDDWQPAQLRRYLALARLLSAVSRLAYTGGVVSQGSVGYFLDTSGRFAVLNPGMEAAVASQGLDAAQREAWFVRLRAYANLNPPVLPSDTVSSLHPLGGHEVARLGYAPHPLTGEPSLVSSYPVHAGNQLLGHFVSFEPTWQPGQSLLHDVGGQMLVVAPSGHVVFGSDPPQPAALAGALHDAGVWTHAYGRVTHYWRHGQMYLATLVQGSDWTVLSTFDWREVLFGGHSLWLLGLGIWAVLMVSLWLLLLWIDRRVFAPAAAHAGQIYASEQLSRSLIELTPIGLCLLDMSDATPVIQNGLAHRHAAAAAEAGLALYPALISSYLAAPANGQLAEIREFELSHSDPTAGQQSLRHLLVGAKQAEFGGRQVLLCALQDLTARVELEAEQGRLRGEAEAANEAKSRFLATMSHEIRTPLHGILGHLELLGRSRLDPEQKVRLNRINQSADSLLLIVNDVLDVSRIESGQLGIDAVGFDPVSLIERVALLYSPLALAKGVDLDFIVDGELASRYSGAVARIEQVLRNLVSNAVKFTQSGRVEIRLLPARQIAGLRFEVADSGIGLTDLQQQRLFQPFVQADASIGSRFGGTGLGLSVCRQLCELMGGSIDVRSTPGVGSVFSFEVRAQTGAGREPLRPLVGRQVVLVSAVITWREELARRLRRWGATVYTTEQLSQVATLDLPEATAVVVFERNLPVDGPPRPHQPGLGHAGPVFRVRADAPLRALFRDGQWWVSCYAGQSLLDALIATGPGEEADTGPDVTVARMIG